LKTLQPLFILGNPRSGTSLFRIILNAHPNIVVPPESGFLQWWYPKYKDWNEEMLNESDVASYVEDVLTSKKIESYNFDQRKLIQFIIKERPINYASLASCLYRFYGREKDIKVWGDKNNYYIHHIPLLCRLYPEAKFIHIVRDGRDVACSYQELEKKISPMAKYRPFLPKGINEIANEWVQNNELIEQELQNSNKIRIRYEDVVLKFDNTLMAVLDFLELPWSQQLQDYASLNDEPIETMGWKMNTKRELQPSQVGRHSIDLNYKKIEEFESIAFRFLNLYNYLER
jgi:hypothetical protein